MCEALEELLPASLLDQLRHTLDSAAVAPEVRDDDLGQVRACCECSCVIASVP